MERNGRPEVHTSTIDICGDHAPDETRHVGKIGFFGLKEPAFKTPFRRREEEPLYWIGELQDGLITS